MQPTTPPSDLTGYKKFSRTIADISNKPRNRTYSMIIFSLLAVTLLGWFAIRPTIRTILQLRREIEDKSKLNQKMDDKIAQLIQAQETYNTIQSKIPLITQAIPPDPDVIKLMSALRQIEQSSGANVTDTHFSNVALASSSATLLLDKLANLESASSATRSSNQTKLLNFSLTSTITGTYDILHSYMDAVSQMRRINEISSLTIKPLSQSSSTEDSGTGGLLEATLQIAAYFRNSGE